MTNRAEAKTCHTDVEKQVCEDAGTSTPGPLEDYEAGSSNPPRTWDTISEGFGQESDGEEEAPLSVPPRPHISTLREAVASSEAF